jgi:enamine deaminase RidA (YjgF/YER057c/UK114 family)
MSITRLGISTRYSQVVIHNNTLYLSGQVPWKTGPAGATIEEQTQEVLDFIDAELASTGSHKSKILSLQIFLRYPADYERMNSVYDTWVATLNAPARNTICGVQFPNSTWLLEMVVVAAL